MVFALSRILEFAKRRRRHVRVPVHLPVALVHANGTVATVLAVNLSPGGMQVRCDRFTLDALLPSARGSAGVAGTPIDAHFQLPLHAGLLKVDVHTRVTYVAPSDGGWFLMGLALERVAPEPAERLRAFLDERAAFDTG